MSALRRLAGRVLTARGGLFAMVQTAIAQGLTMGVNILTGVITARLLGPVGRGEFAAAGIWLLMPSLLATAGLQNAIVYAVRQRPEDAGGIGATALLAATAVFVPLGLAAAWVLPSVMHAYPADIVTVARWALALSMANVWMMVVRQWLLATHGFAMFNGVMYGVVMAYLGALVLLALTHWLVPASAIYAQVGSTILGLFAVVPAVISALRRAPVRDLGRHARPLLGYALRAAPIDVVTALSQNMDRLVLVTLIAPAELGLYVVAVSFARILSVLQTAISAVMLSDLSGRPAVEVAAFTAACFRVLFWVLLLGCGAIVLVDRPLLQLVYGPAFAAAVPVFRILLLDAALSCLAQVLIQAFLARNASGVASTIQVIAFAVSAVAVLLLAPRLGGIGAALALVAGSLLRLGLLLAALRRIEVGVPNMIPQRSDLAPVLRRMRPPAATLP